MRDVMIMLTSLAICFWLWLSVVSSIWCAAMALQLTIYRHKSQLDLADLNPWYALAAVMFTLEQIIAVAVFRTVS